MPKVCPVDFGQVYFKGSSKFFGAYSSMFDKAIVERENALQNKHQPIDSVQPLQKKPATDKTGMSNSIKAFLGFIGGIGLGAGLGAIVGTFVFPGIGTVVGAAIGAGCGAVLGAIAGMSFTLVNERSVNKPSAAQVGINVTSEPIENEPGARPHPMAGLFNNPNMATKTATMHVAPKTSTPSINQAATAKQQPNLQDPRHLLQDEIKTDRSSSLTM